MIDVKFPVSRCWICFWGRRTLACAMHDLPAHAYHGGFQWSLLEEHHWGLEGASSEAFEDSHRVVREQGPSSQTARFSTWERRPCQTDQAGVEGETGAVGDRWGWPKACDKEGPAAWWGQRWRCAGSLHGQGCIGAVAQVGGAAQEVTEETQSRLLPLVLHHLRRQECCQNPATRERPSAPQPLEARHFWCQVRIGSYA